MPLITQPTADDLRWWKNNTYKRVTGSFALTACEAFYVLSWFQAIELTGVEPPNTAYIARKDTSAPTTAAAQDYVKSVSYQYRTRKRKPYRGARARNDTRFDQNRDDNYRIGGVYATVLVYTDSRTHVVPADVCRCSDSGADYAIPFYTQLPHNKRRTGKCANPDDKSNSCWLVGCILFDEVRITYETIDPDSGNGGVMLIQNKLVYGDYADAEHDATEFTRAYAERQYELDEYYQNGFRAACVINDVQEELADMDTLEDKLICLREGQTRLEHIVGDLYLRTGERAETCDETQMFIEGFSNYCRSKHPVELVERLIAWNLNTYEGAV